MKMSPAPRDLILKFLLSADDGQLTARDAVAACALFGIRENSVRVALVRLAAAGMIEAAERGAYRLGANASDLAEDVRDWRNAESRVGPWSGAWIVAHCAGLGRTDRAQLRRRERALELLGFRELERELFVRPDNLLGGVTMVRERLLKLGLEPSACVFLAMQFDPTREARARGLWDGKGLDRGYRRTAEKLRGWMARAGFAAVGFTWGVIALAFAAMAWASGQAPALAVPVFLLAIALIAGRQLALAILMHDASHGTLFRHRWLNEVFADWVCARPIWNDLKKYRSHHLAHHARTGQADDPDLSLVAPFPTTRASLARKLLRDLSGLTGVKFFIGRFLMDAGYLRWTVANERVRLPADGQTFASRGLLFLRNATPTLITNALLFGLLWTAGHAWLYLAWVVAYMTPFAAFVRIRSMAEHACTENVADNFLNTRTTRAGWIARATVAPINVNYHIEHHVMASVPYFRLPLMHRMLRERNATGAPPGYLEVLRIVSSRRAA